MIAGSREAERLAEPVATLFQAAHGLGVRDFVLLQERRDTRDLAFSGFQSRASREHREIEPVQVRSRPVEGRQRRQKGERWLAIGNTGQVQLARGLNVAAWLWLLIASLFLAYGVDSDPATWNDVIPGVRRNFQGGREGMYHAHPSVTSDRRIFA